jgi:hypothetical protein
MATAEKKEGRLPENGDVHAADGEMSDLINASGHVQELDRNFSLLSAAGVGIVVGNVWPA